jgi:hypothetical protein
MNIDENLLKQLEQDLQAIQYIHVAYSLPVDNPRYEVTICFDPRTGIEVHRSYRQIIDLMDFEPLTGYERITIDVEAYKRGEGFKAIYPPGPLETVIR